MSEQNIFYSFFKFLKNKINSFISNAAYSSSKINQHLYYSTSNIPIKFPYFQQKYLNYIISEKRKNNNFISPYPKNTNSNISKIINDSSIFNDNSSISTSLSIIEDSNNKKVQNYLDKENDFITYLSNNKENKFISNFKNKKFGNNSNIFKNNCLIGNKTLRNYFYNKENIDINEYENDLDEIYERENNFSENIKDKEKRLKEKLLGKFNNRNDEDDDKEITISCDNYYNLKQKNNQKNKTNNLFKGKLSSNKLNKYLNSDTDNKSNISEKKLYNIFSSFKNLRYTHPQRFSYHSTNKKSKISKKKLSNDSSNYSISVENNINILSTLIKRKEDKNIKIENSKFSLNESKKNNEILTNKNQDTNFIEYKEIVQNPQNKKNEENSNFNIICGDGSNNNDFNLGPNNNYNLNINNNLKSQENNININITMNENKIIDNMNNNNENCSMDLEEELLINSKYKQKIENVNNSSFNASTNPFLIESKKYENNYFKNNNAINPFISLKNESNSSINNNIDENYFGHEENIKPSQNKISFNTNIFNSNENKIKLKNNNPFLFNNNKNDKPILSNNFKFSFGKK